MAAFGTAAGRPLQGRGGSPGFRFTLYAALSIVVMFLDQRHGWLERARYVLQASAYPIQLAVSSPSAAWRWIHESFEAREALQAENRRLQALQRDLELRSMRFEALARENGVLRGLRDALPPVAERWLAAEIVNVQLSSLRQRVLINRGATNGVFKGQAVLDDKGLVGQTTHIGPWSAEVILITDPEHAVPVQIERTGLHTIAVGTGDTTFLALPYLPPNADIKSGDLLVTSGLGGVFPAGYPVARVTEVHRDAVQPLAQVRAAPLASIDTDRELALVWFRADHPAAPIADATGDLRAGNATLQPQAAPPHPPLASAKGPGARPTTPPASSRTRSEAAAPATPAAEEGSPAEEGPPSEARAPAAEPEMPAAPAPTAEPEVPAAPTPTPPGAPPPEEQ
ncbi:MAG: rod shape-determining protein MreC [Gammaproteobacteria bacterium]|nr:MAG: rod shape-determining protein MreC [Gammaproteobacteria bacterium]